MAARHFAIIGDGAAGMTAAQRLRHLDPAARVTIFSHDPHPAYYRAALTNYLLGELRDDQVWAVTPSFFAAHRVERVHAHVSSIDLSRRELVLSTGHRVQFDAVLVASGARARPAPFEGAELGGVMTLRTLQDARVVMDQVKQGGARRAVVVGGGALGIEWAIALRERGSQVTMLVRQTGLLWGQLDGVAADLVAARMRHIGIDVRFQEEVRAAIGTGGNLMSVETVRGTRYPCDLLAIAIGVVCNTELLDGTPVTLGRSRAVVVNDRMLSSVPNVYAAGDVAEFEGKTTQLWEPARRQAEVAAYNMAGVLRNYQPGALYFATRLADLDFASVGVIDKGSDAIVDQPRATGNIAYRKLVFDGPRLIGALLLGQRKEQVRQRGRLYKALIDRGADVRPIKHRLLENDFDIAGWLEQGKLASPIGQPRAGGASPAQLKGTQAIDLDQLMGQIAAARGAPGAPPPPGGGPRKAAGQKGTMALSAALFAADSAGQKPAVANASADLSAIGLPLAHERGAIAQGRGQRAWLEGAFGQKELDRAVTSIGRDPAGHVVLADPTACFLHAQISRHAGDLYLRDAGSRTGTFVGAQQVIMPHKLADGDVIRIGRQELVFRSAAAAAPAPLPAGPAAARAMLRMVGAGGMNQTFPLTSSMVTVGREASSAIQLADVGVSRRHAVLSQVEGRWFVADLHSLTGTLLNGRAIEPGCEVPLSDRDQIRIGGVTLVFSTS